MAACGSFIGSSVPQVLTLARGLIAMHGAVAVHRSGRAWTLLIGTGATTNTGLDAGGLG